jgi:ABC-type sugar transport system substrate-binding protein
VPGILAAAAAGLPVFDVGGKTDADAVAAAGPLYVPVPTVDFWEQGRMAGRYLVDRLRARSAAVGCGEPARTVAIIEGRPGSKQSIGRSGGAAETLAVSTWIEIVARVPAYFDRERARTVAEVILRDHPGIDAIFCANDLMALGVVEAVDAAGGVAPVLPAAARSGAAAVVAGSSASIARRPLIVGVDGTEEAKAAVTLGAMDATVAFSPADVAAVILGAVRAVLDGGEAPRGRTVPSRLFVCETASLQERGLVEEVAG